MKKIKWVLMTTAVVLGIGGAIITRQHPTASTTTRPFYAANGCVSTNQTETQKPPESR